MGSVRPQQNNASGMSMHSVRLVFPCHLFNVNATRNAAEMLAPAVVFWLLYIYYFSTHQHLVPPTIKPDGFWHLLQPENITSSYSVSLSLSLHRTHTPSRDSLLAARCVCRYLSWTHTALELTTAKKTAAWTFIQHLRCLHPTHRWFLFPAQVVPQM